MKASPTERYSDFLPSTLRWLWILFIAVLTLTVGAEFFVHPHAAFGIDGTFGFHAWFGFAACVAIVLVSKLAGLLLKRKEGYYPVQQEDAHE